MKAHKRTAQVVSERTLYRLAMLASFVPVLQFRWCGQYRQPAVQGCSHLGYGGVPGDRQGSEVPELPSSGLGFLIEVLVRSEAEAFRNSVESITGPISRIISREGMPGVYAALDDAGKKEFERVRPDP